MRKWGKKTTSFYVQSYVTLPTEEPVARDLVQVAVAAQKAAEAASVLANEARMLAVPLTW
jgi:hypothetical protein